VTTKPKTSARRSRPYRPQARLARRTIELEPGRPVAVDVNCAESPLSWLRLGCSLIDDAQYRAGLRLHADFIRARLMPEFGSAFRLALSHVSSPGAPRRDLPQASEKIVAAKQRYYAALEAVGPELSPILVEICCHSTGIAAAERVLSMPRRSGKIVLKLALTRLARWYGLLAPARAGGARPPMAFPQAPASPPL
jgi:hypothetical protein